MPSAAIAIPVLLVAFVLLRLSRLGDRRDATAHEPTGEPLTRLPIRTRNAYVDAMTRLGIGISLAVLVVSAAFFLIANTSAGIGTAILALGLPSLWIVNVRLSHGGVVELWPDRLIIRTRNSTHDYPWRDIESVRVATWHESSPGERGFVRILGADVREPFARVARVRLRRRIGMSMGLWRTRYGTEIEGLPIPMRAIKVFVDNPEALAALAQPHVDSVARAALSSTPIRPPSRQASRTS
ncbi:MAG: hypothetical protein WEB04_09570 [Dehalococcoidia bacterium]